MTLEHLAEHEVRVSQIRDDHTAFPEYLGRTIRQGSPGPWIHFSAETRVVDVEEARNIVAGWGYRFRVPERPLIHAMSERVARLSDGGYHPVRLSADVRELYALGEPEQSV